MGHHFVRIPTQYEQGVVGQVNTLRAPMIVGGFGLWFSSNLMYLRSMAQIHMFHNPPLAFPLMLLVCLSPWLVAVLVQSYLLQSTI